HQQEDCGGNEDDTAEAEERREVMAGAYCTLSMDEICLALLRAAEREGVLDEVLAWVADDADPGVIAAMKVDLAKEQLKRSAVRHSPPADGARLPPPGRRPLSAKPVRRKKGGKR